MFDLTVFLQIDFRFDYTYVYQINFLMVCVNNLVAYFKIWLLKMRHNVNLTLEYIYFAEELMLNTVLTRVSIVTRCVYILMNYVSFFLFTWSLRTFLFYSKQLSS